MRGEDAADMQPGSFNAAGRLARAATLIAGPAMNALLAVFLFGASFMAGFPAPVANPQISDNADRATLAAYGLQPGDILLQAGDQPVQVSAISDMQYTVMRSGEAAAASTAQSLTVGRNGELVDVALSADTDIDTVLAEIDVFPVLTTQITMIAEPSDEYPEPSPAYAAELQPGDLFYSVNDTVITEGNPLNEVIKRNAGQEVMLTLLREGNWVKVPITPRVDPPAGQGALGVGIAPTTNLATLSFLPALWEGVRSTGEYIGLVLQLPMMLILGQVSASEAELTGPLGIARMVGDAASATIDTGLWFPIWRLSAILSAALAITNMLPLPALDGGRLLFILIEAIRGRRVNPEREGFIHMVGFVLLLGLIVLITVRDFTTTSAGIPWREILGQ